MFYKNSHCSYCGTLFKEGSFPKTCSICLMESYLNPLPVIVSMVKVWDSESDKQGLLLIRRAINPKIGEWAFPGGFIELGETWQEAAARELKEETGFLTEAEDYILYDVPHSSNGNILIFCTHDADTESEDLIFVPNNEVSEIKIQIEPIELAFPTHTFCFKNYYNLDRRIWL